MAWGRGGNPKIKKYAHLLGVMSDKEFAELVGCHPDYPYYLRKRRGLLCKRTGCITGIPWERFDSLFGKEEDEKIAEIIGCKVSAVKRHRRALGIPAFFHPRVCPCGESFTPGPKGGRRLHCSKGCGTMHWYYATKTAHSEETIAEKMLEYGKKKRRGKNV